ncbi:hypothetical protein L7F22_050661 [Adiantum nelumboides]|nr:hypothetical protein [Adiantum nelumboides]
MEESHVAIDYDSVHAGLGEEASPFVYDSNLSALTASSEAFPPSLVLRRIIQDTDNELLSTSAVEEEVEFLSLCINADKEEEVPVETKPTQQQLTAPQDPPWLRRGPLPRKFTRSPLLELHQEIVAFCDLVSPTSEDHHLRTEAVQRVSDVIKSVWKKCQVNVFGSFATGLYLPTSDIDMVILDSGCYDIQSGLKAIANSLARAEVSKNVQIIGKARVPIIKFVEVESNVSFDVSFDLENGPEAAVFIKDALNSIPPLRPLCFVLKTFLQQRELNEVYTGGIGSYALLVMLLAYLQTHANKSLFERQYERSRIEQNLGVLLVDFFDFYGRSLNFKDVGISCRDGGHFFKKKEREFTDSKKQLMLAVEDPQAPQNDIAKGSYNFQKVRVAFLLAYRQLTNLRGDNAVHPGMLARIVRVDEKLAARRVSALPSPDRKKKKPKKSRQKSKVSPVVQVEQESSQESGIHKRSRSAEYQPKKKYRKLNDRKRSHVR